MKVVAPAKDKYFLKSLHQEIDFFDRKLSYMAHFEVFASDTDREEAEKKIATKRATLEKKARALVAAGVEFDPAETELAAEIEVEAPGPEVPEEAFV